MKNLQVVLQVKYPYQNGAVHIADGGIPILIAGKNGSTTKTLETDNAIGINTSLRKFREHHFLSKGEAQKFILIILLGQLNKTK